MTPEELRAAGGSIIPCGPDKKPLIPWKQYQEQFCTNAEFKAWEKLKPACWAMVTGKLSGIITLDFDGQPGLETFDKIICGTLCYEHRYTPSGGLHMDYVHPGWPVRTLNSKMYAELGRRWPGLDIRGDGGYVCFYGRTDKGKYEWNRRYPYIPYPVTVLPDDLRELLGLLHAPEPETKQPTNGKVRIEQAGRVDAERLIRDALDRVGSGLGRNNSGMWLACQLRDNGFSQADTEQALRNYRSRCPEVNTKGQREAYTLTEVWATLREAYSRPPREPWERKTTTPAAKPAPVITIKPPEPPNLLTGFEPEDVGNAQRLIAMYGPRLRYCHAFNKWLAWDSCRWEVDDRDHVRELTHRTMTEFAMQAVKANNEALTKFAAGCRKGARITNAMREAQPYLAIKPAELDTHSDLLNFKNGTLDLKTGRLIPHDQEHFITKLIHYDYRPDATCPTFLAFLKRITEKHPGLIGYLQKALGYSLTGHTIEKAVFLLHGRGDNGKSTLLSLFLKLLEEYGVLLQIDTLMVRQESNNTQADLADLRGARFVMTSETEEGQRLAEGKLKRITQGMGRIKATRKYENPVEFPESHKLWIDANHLPIVRGTDNAIWNRLHPIPFDVTIPKEEQDPELPNKLIAEAEGILTWAVAGAIRYFRERLGKPPDVEQVGQAWRAESDQVGRFIAEICIVGEYAQVKARQLYSAYRRWAEESGERAITETAFGLRIVEEFPKDHTNVGAVYRGIGLRSATA